MTQPETPIVIKVADTVRKRMEGEHTGHDWWHVYRVWKAAERINESEGGDADIIALGALLHDIADWKFHDGDLSAGPEAARALLRENAVPDEVIERVAVIVSEVTYKGAGVETTPSTLEGKIVQDADRLDALGAIGVARAFAYGGAHGRELHNPDVAPVLHGTFEEYKQSRGTTINHFYEKLLLLRDRIHTAAGKQLAAERHEYMQQYLERFLREWDGK